MSTDMGVPFLGKVPLDPRFSKAGESGVSLFAPAEEEEEGVGGGPARVTADAPSVKALRGIVDQILISVGESPAEPETMDTMDDGGAAGAAAGAAAGDGMDLGDEEEAVAVAAAKAMELDSLRAQMQALQIKIDALES
jgi:hypothetical protein